MYIYIYLYYVDMKIFYVDIYIYIYMPYVYTYKLIEIYLIILHHDISPFAAKDVNTLYIGVS